jgi:sodium-dependent dicarboxylate transporter 2/3/5
VSRIQEAASPYANELIFLFMGGFMLAQAMQRWGLHRRIALGVLSAVGTRPAALVGGFMLATAFLSMWVSNTATAVMMLPIALSVVQLVQRGAPEGARSELPGALMLGIAYAASIGGFATFIGAPPNAIAYATGHVSVPRMARAGLLLDLMGIAVILVVAYTFLLWAFGVRPGVVPPWAAAPGG